MAVCEGDCAEPAGWSESVDDCELCRRTITGRFFFAALEATNTEDFLTPADPDDFLSFFVVSGSGEGGCTITCELVPADELSSVSLSDSGGEINRAVGRGPAIEGPLDFFRMGCGIGVAVLEIVEGNLVSGLLRVGRWRVVALEVPVRLLLP